MAGSALPKQDSNYLHKHKGLTGHNAGTYFSAAVCNCIYLITASLLLLMQTKHFPLLLLLLYIKSVQIGELLDGFYCEAARENASKKQDCSHFWSFKLVDQFLFYNGARRNSRGELLDERLTLWLVRTSTPKQLFHDTHFTSQLLTARRKKANYLIMYAFFFQHWICTEAGFEIWPKLES